MVVRYFKVQLLTPVETIHKIEPLSTISIHPLVQTEVAFFQARLLKTIHPTIIHNKHLSISKTRD